MTCRSIPACLLAALFAACSDGEAPTIEPEPSALQKATGEAEPAPVAEEELPGQAAPAARCCVEQSDAAGDVWCRCAPAADCGAFLGMWAPTGSPNWRSVSACVRPATFPQMGGEPTEWLCYEDAKAVYPEGTGDCTCSRAGSTSAGRIRGLCSDTASGLTCVANCAP